MTTAELIEQAASLPVDERALLADSLLRSLNPPDAEKDKAWASVARRRLEELRSGKVRGVPGEEVFAKVWKRFKS